MHATADDSLKLIIPLVNGQQGFVAAFQSKCLKAMFTS